MRLTAVLFLYGLMTVKAYRIDFMAVKTPILMTVKAHRNDFMAVNFTKSK